MHPDLTCIHSGLSHTVGAIYLSGITSATHLPTLHGNTPVITAHHINAVLTICSEDNLTYSKE